MQLCEISMCTCNCNCASTNIDCVTYVGKVYKLRRTYNIWKSKFPHVLDESIWPPTSHVSFKLVLDINLRCKPKGQLNSIRIRGVMDIEWTDQPRLCSYYRNLRHITPTCLHLEGTSKTKAN